VSVVTPYRSQCALLRELLGEGVEVNTVDSYQGRETDIMVVCTVRSDGMGFIDDHRRLNVAITRARHGLVRVLREGSRRGGWDVAACRRRCSSNMEPQQVGRDQRVREKACGCGGIRGLLPRDVRLIAGG
jgi:hypothetical protein